MILLPLPRLHPHPPHHHHPHPLSELDRSPSELGSRGRGMPESGDVEVLAPPRTHLASRRRFDLKLDLPSALSGGRDGGGVAGGGGELKKPRLEMLSAPAVLSSRLPQNVPCSSCVGGSTTIHGGSDLSKGHAQGDRPLSAAACLSPQSPCLCQHSACLEHTSFRAPTPATRVEEDTYRRRVSPVSSPSPSSSFPPFRAISSAELAAKLRKSRCPVLVIDCRPFLCYNALHVQGAVNVSCADRFNRKRLQQGKVSVLDLLAATHGKDSFRRRCLRDVVLYDERGSSSGCSSSNGNNGGGSSSGCSSSNGSNGGGSSSSGGSNGHHVLESDSALHIVLSTLLREGRQPAVLQGGMKQFEAEYPELCWCSRTPQQSLQSVQSMQEVQALQEVQEEVPLMSMPSRLLCSPTNDTMEPEIETATASRVLPFLYLGNERDAAELERLRRHDITYVLNVTAHVPHYWHAHGIRYKRIPASDSAQQNLKQYFEEAIDYIDDARQKGASVLIHCHAGVSRSATITIAYILKHSQLPMGDAYKYVKGKRGIISPNFNFLGQLLEFEQDLNQGNALRVLHPRLAGLESPV